MRAHPQVATGIAHLIGPGRLSYRNGKLVYEAANGTPFRLDLSTLQAVYCYGKVSPTSDAVAKILDARLPCTFLSHSGSRCLGRLVADDSSQTSLKIRQYQCFLDEPFRLEFSKSVVQKKLTRYADAARHYQRHGYKAATETKSQLQRLATSTDTSCSRAELLGLEGAGTALWFRLLKELVPLEWRFKKRSRRPPKDPANALLSLGSTFLCYRVQAAISAAGLDPCIGFFHSLRAGRPALACDLMEEFRADTVDRWLLTFAARRQLRTADFQIQEGACRLPDGCFSQVLSSWEGHWQNSKSANRLSETVGSLLRSLSQKNDLNSQTAITQQENMSRS